MVKVNPTISWWGCRGGPESLASEGRGRSWGSLLASAFMGNTSPREALWKGRGMLRGMEAEGNRRQCLLEENLES